MFLGRPLGPPQLQNGGSLVSTQQTTQFDGTQSTSISTFYWFQGKEGEEWDKRGSDDDDDDG